MKKTLRKIFIASLLFVIPFPVFANNITPEGIKVRNEIQSFLKNEGLMPYVDEDESLCFKFEGNLFWIDVVGDAPFFISFHRQGYGAHDADRLSLLRAFNDIHLKYAAVKCYANKSDNIIFTVESFCPNANCFTVGFFNYMNVLNTVYSELRENYTERAGSSSSSSQSLSILSAQVAVTDKNKNVEVDFGQNIYASATKYLTPRIEVSAPSSGSVDIYCKFFDADGNLSSGSSSPAGYTWVKTINVSKGRNKYVLAGWGKNVAGNWPEGRYRMEFYCNGKLLYTHSFTIY